MTIAITGATGLLGRSIIPLLTGMRHCVRALHYKEEPLFDRANLETVKGGLFDMDSLNRLVKDCEVVIHCAAKISIQSNRDDSVYNTNVNGTINTFEAAKNAGTKRFVHISSIHAYQQSPADELLNESSPYCCNKSPRYDQSKRDAEKFVLQQASTQMEVVVINPTGVIGPGDNKPSLMGKAIMDIYNGKIHALINGGFDFCDVRDVAGGIVNAIDKGRNGQSYLLSGKWYSLADLQQIIIGIRGDDRGVPVLPGWAGYLGLPFTRLLAAINGQTPLYTKESLYTLLNGSKQISSIKAAKELHYTCRPIWETITDSIDWFKKAGYLA